jgi:hypothetical protein
MGDGRLGWLGWLRFWTFAKAARYHSESRAAALRTERSSFNLNCFALWY